MWIPSLLEGMNESEMKSLGSQLSASDIYDINNSSLKDDMIGFSQIQSHSSLENDYLKNGFWAMSLEEELPNEGLYAEFIVRIEDVSDKALAGVAETMTEKEKQSLIDKNISALRKEVKKDGLSAAELAKKMAEQREQYEEKLEESRPFI